MMLSAREAIELDDLVDFDEDEGLDDSMVDKSSLVI